MDECSSFPFHLERLLQCAFSGCTVRYSSFPDIFLCSFPVLLNLSLIFQFPFRVILWKKASRKRYCTTKAITFNCLQPSVINLHVDVKSSGCAGKRCTVIACTSNGSHTYSKVNCEYIVLGPAAPFLRFCLPVITAITERVSICQTLFLQVLLSVSGGGFCAMTERVSMLHNSLSIGATVLLGW